MATKRKGSASSSGRPFRNMTLADLGEDGLVEELSAMVESLASRSVLVGCGDDCAVLKSKAKGRERILFKTDCVVEGVHYLATSAPSHVGWKAMARCLSDIAAMGGAPEYALVTIVMPGEKSVSYVKGIYRGLKKAATRFGVSIVGGETSSSHSKSQAMISVSLMGSVDGKKCILRSGGKPGHYLFVTGRLGGSLRGKHLKFVPRLEEGRWLASEASPSAMMDLSDGLARDLPRLAEASGCGFEIDLGSVPRSRGCDLKAALNDGEDFELLLAVPPARAVGLGDRWEKAFPGLALTQIGKFTGVGQGSDPDSRGGWEHFRN